MDSSEKPSIIFYNVPNQLLDKWQLFNKTQAPSFLALWIKSWAFLPCPCPKEIVSKVNYLDKQ
jgi:hypothetical protein